MTTRRIDSPRPPVCPRQQRSPPRRGVPPLWHAALLRITRGNADACTRIAPRRTIAYVPGPGDVRGFGSKTLRSNRATRQPGRLCLYPQAKLLSEDCQPATHSAYSRSFPAAMTCCSSWPASSLGFAQRQRPYRQRATTRMLLETGQNPLARANEAPGCHTYRLLAPPCCQ